MFMALGVGVWGGLQGILGREQKSSSSLKIHQHLGELKEDRGLFVSEMRVSEAKLRLDQSGPRSNTSHPCVCSVGPTQEGRFRNSGSIAQSCPIRTHILQVAINKTSQLCAERSI